MNSPSSSAAVLTAEERTRLATELVEWRAHSKALFEMVRTMPDPYNDPEGRMERYERALAEYEAALAAGGSDAEAFLQIEARFSEAAVGISDVHLVLLLDEARFNVRALRTRLQRAGALPGSPSGHMTLAEFRQWVGMVLSSASDKAGDSSASRTKLRAR